MTRHDKRRLPLADPSAATHPPAFIAARLGVRPRRIAGVMIVDSNARRSEDSEEFDFHTPRPWRRSAIQSLRQWWDQLRHRRRARRDLEQLLKLDDRLLADVGLTRSQVSAAIRAGLSAAALLPPQK